MYQITNTEGRAFNVRVVCNGDKYGLNDCLRHDHDDPLVEFYDATQDVAKFGPRGQFVQSYYLSTLRCHDHPSGLALHCGVPVWTIDATNVREALAYAAGVLDGAD